MFAVLFGILDCGGFSGGWCECVAEAETLDANSWTGVYKGDFMMFNEFYSV